MRLKRRGCGTRDAEELRRLLNERGVETKNDKTWSQLIDHAHSHFVEPSLIEPTILYDYPVELSPFARVTDEDPEIVERSSISRAGWSWATRSRSSTMRRAAQRFAMQAAEGAGGNIEAEQGDPDYVEALAFACRRPAASGFGNRPIGDGPGREGLDQRRDLCSRRSANVPLDRPPLAHTSRLRRRCPLDRGGA